MAGAITYNSANLNPAYIFQAAGGGVTFGANQTANTAFAYFSNTAAKTLEDALALYQAGKI